MTAAYVAVMTVLSVVILAVQLSQGWSAIWILFALAGICVALVEVLRNRKR